MLSYAIKTNQAKLVSHFESKVPGWMSSWNLNDGEQRELAHVVADTLFADDQSSRALFFLTHYLSTLPSGEGYSQQSVNIATKAVVTAIRAPVSLYREKNNLYQTVVSHTISDSSLLKLLDLLRIFCMGRVEDYVNFRNDNQEVFSKFDLCHESSLKNMRLLGLCVLAARCTTSAESSHELSYSDIAKALEVSSDEEVEEWVVEAISNGLLDATMDQLNGSIKVSRSVRVSFEHEEWVALQRKLSSWRNNLASFLDVIKSHQNKHQ